MSTIEVQTEELKKALFMEGKETIEDVCNLCLTGFEDKDTLDKIMDDAFVQMSRGLFEEYYAEYVGGSHVC